jgi:hypothetical protein
VLTMDLVKLNLTGQAKILPSSTLANLQLGFEIGV